MKKALILILLFSTTAIAQNRTTRSLIEAGYVTNGFYVNLGYTHGPSFSSYFDYVEENYQPVSPIENFGGNISFAIGYLNRLHRNFAIDVGFSIYGMNKSFDVIDTSSLIPENRIKNELNYQSAIFTGTLPVWFEFSPTQRFVPHLGIGISIFSLRLDHYRDNIAFRDTRTAAGAHAEVGLAYKFTRRIWADLRGRWHVGNSHLWTIDDDPNTIQTIELREFEIDLNIAQFGAGINYFFH